MGAGQWCIGVFPWKAMFALEIVSIYLEHLPSSHTSSSPCIAAVKAWGKSIWFQFCLHEGTEACPSSPKSTIIHSSDVVAICVSPPARTVPHCLE